MITITIKYQFRRSDEWHVLEMTPQEFFYEELEQYAIDDVPTYDYILEYLHELLGDKALEILITEERIFDTETQQEMTHVTRYWNDQKNWVNEVTVSPPDAYHEVLLCTIVSETPNVTEILRMVWRDGVLSPIDHTFITDNPDGTESVGLISLV